jgi:hypothetical protein
LIFIAVITLSRPGLCGRAATTGVIEAVKFPPNCALIFKKREVAPAPEAAFFVNFLMLLVRRQRRGRESRKVEHDNHAIGVSQIFATLTVLFE